MLIADTAASAVFLHEWRHLSEPAHTEFQHLRQQYEAEFRALIAQGVQAGELYTPDPAFAALTLLASLNWLPNWYRPEGTLTPDQIAQRLTDQLLDGLAY
ncbi:TetR/AcrR family transcriptional regulator C-terminal domain-containing protein [Hymenobacter sp. J193]|uniref:TetR/AcrR family transcriptional regulator C-terminal domain-containing protein n=1 Tax=Hymenobacter sp. J193 TaxID=2898429 RepID=UPI0021518421|nr:TetR/AcrR family transcriptional regulator C-terminal domain-containing protein [Hymenobacter sp. J193]MCR5886704.1 TetR/AcrR family transcriptional regulator C-terminal domain-containing protein [Hymenobacter sp. J193]